MKKYAIIVAGGSGSRMKTVLPKQFLLLAGKPVLMHTIERFWLADKSMNLVVVLPQEQQETWQELCLQHQFTIPHAVVAGGKTRFGSVKNGLAAITGQNGVVAVHDGVRPLVTVEVISEAFAVAADKGNAVVSVPLKDSIRKVTEAGSVALDRSSYRLVQTPQCFRLDLLQQAYNQPEEPYFTDDASVVEKLGEAIHLVDGSYQNIKITTPEDMLLAETLLQQDRDSSE